MLPDFLFPVGNSMQDLSHEDFSLLDGGASSGEKDSNCSSGLHVVGGSHFISTAAPVLAVTATATTSTASHLLTEPIGTNSALHPRLRPTIHEHAGSIYADNSPSLIAGLKLEEHSARDLFPSHASTWHHHPLNNYGHHHSQHYQQHHYQEQHHQQQEQHHQHLHNQYRFMNATGVSSKLLLQGSDDPLICRGANSVADDDPPAEFSTLIAEAATKEQQPQPHQILQQMSQPLRPQSHRISSVLKPQRQPSPSPSPSRTTNGCSSLTKQQLKIKASRMSHMNQCQQTQIRVPPAPGSPKTRATKTKKNPGSVKLRFHHQALPAEYLSHYEATQATGVAKKDVAPAKPTAETQKLTPPKSANENVRSWLQKIAELHRASQKQQQSHETQSTHDANNNHAQVASAMSETDPGNAGTLMETKATKSFRTSTSTSTPAPTHTKRVVNYSDLPYMGEITLDHSKPKRGRKPKKADICHLIYKNYGTILPGTPKNKLDKSLIEPSRGIKELEEGEAGREGEEGQQDQCFKMENIRRSEEEPLNLCLRDQSSEDLYSISSIEDEEEEEDEEDENDLNEASAGDTRLMTSADVANDSLLAANLKLAMPSVLLEEATTSLPGCQTLEPFAPGWSVHTTPTTAPVQQSSLHPMSLYYQKLIESGTLVSSSGLSNLGFPVETIQRDNQLALKIPIPSGLFLTPKLEKSSPAGSPLDYPEPMSTPSSLKSENSATTNASLVAVQQLQLSPHPAPKRKRSAIYIPPMPAENANNPSNEVSICKFKFTGGARPTLQEKKMLSVDAGGNYRYYSGTGDKSTRGYEFFPRESVQQSGGVLPGVNCATAGGGEKITLDIPPPSAGLSNELLQIPDSPTRNMLLLTPPVPTLTTPIAESSRAGGAVSVSISMDASPNPRSSCCSTSSNNELSHPSNQQQQKHHFADRKTKSRRSVQRERLEKTFKEKGFLIQTQQLESAEGATYCKFRQLKKFTRYLFRNWKDYLPDELQQANEAAAACAAAAALNQHQLHHHHHHQHQQRSAVTAKLAESMPVTSKATDPVIENLLASHEFGVAEGLPPCILQERLVEDSRMTVEPSLD